MSHFFALPRELRDMIYLELLTPELPTQRHSHPQVLATCHQAHDEAIEMFYALNRIYIDIRSTHVCVHNGLDFETDLLNAVDIDQLPHPVHRFRSVGIRILGTEYYNCPGPWYRQPFARRMFANAAWFVQNVLSHSQTLQSLHILFDWRYIYASAFQKPRVVMRPEASLLEQFGTLKGLKDVEIEGHSCYGVAEMARENMMESS